MNTLSHDESSLMVEQTTADDIPSTIIEKAIEWNIHLRSEEATPSDHQDYQTWRNEDTSHAQAASRLENMWSLFSRVNPKLAKTSLESTLKPDAVTQGLKRHAKVIGLILMMAVSGYLGLQAQPVKVMLAEYKTPIGQQRTIDLPDHSQIVMNTNTALDIDFSNNQRLIKLYQGEVLLKVSKDKTRPFIVATVQGTARALGTQYNVRIVNATTYVSVIESVVEACNAPGILSRSKKTCVILHKGEGTRLTTGNTEPVKPVDSDAISAWINGTLAFDDVSLDIVLADLQRYSVAKIEFDPVKMSQFYVSGVLPVTDIYRSFKVLTNRFPIRMTSPSPDKIIVQSQN